MIRPHLVALGIVAMVLLTGFGAGAPIDAGPGISGTVHLSIGAVAGGVVVLLFNLHRHSVKSELRHLEQEAKIGALLEHVRDLRAQVKTLAQVLGQELDP